ncbi:hypothetical protein C7121_06240 [Paenibacillus glucanolyticus]|jgi:hypothetical protein|uniref:hypothetical protein n=1 Tax=Paenibacillus TaxID=44249 RepID=UPI0003E20454|nr:MULTISPECIES: hypothetical protein [Paenibacillus]AVV60108.1 hypothetical protein C7121_06240 [Paenibacillus glucanolyticus]ETT38576.1 hypothetical protein C169_13237 [Paenibacillus sp. FSL R5-808]
MSTERELRQLYQDVHFFAAALSEALISIWEEDPAGVYSEVDRGFIDRYTADYVRVRNAETGCRTHYSRDTAMFKRI